ncbi:MAG: EscU/YscU/HrcU family type III secretion system export apparatus switch protein [Myxococcota bacterium]
MAQEKTEEPTPKKLREARRRGEVPRSRELGTAAVVLSATAVLVWLGPFALDRLLRIFDLAFAAAGGAGPSPPAALGQAARLGAGALLPLLLVVASTAGLVAYLQVGPLFTVRPLAPRFERIDPVKGLRRLFSQRQLVELLKTLAKMGVVGVVAWVTLRDGLRGVVALSGAPADRVLSAGGALVSSLLLRVGLTMGGIAVLDVIYQRWRHRRDQRMTRHEVKREHRETEGDPHAKQHRERMHREVVEHAVLEEVRQADVLVVNPTHLAVALRYDEDEHEAPQVRAKGQDALARRMIEAAEQAGVPVMRDVPLARTLYELELGDEIPPELYEAVAAVLQAAWREREESE